MCYLFLTVVCMLTVGVFSLQNRTRLVKDADEIILASSQFIEESAFTGQNLCTNINGHHSMIPIDILHTLPQGLVELMKEILSRAWSSQERQDNEPPATRLPYT